VASATGGTIASLAGKKGCLHTKERKKLRKKLYFKYDLIM